MEEKGYKFYGKWKMFRSYFVIRRPIQFYSCRSGRSSCCCRERANQTIVQMKFIHSSIVNFIHKTTYRIHEKHAIATQLAHIERNLYEAW